MARLSPFGVVAALSLLANFVAAQVSTACQPLNTTGCPADPAFGTDYTFQFNSTPSISFWETTAGSVSYSADNGATFTINKQGDSPTVRTSFYIFFGRTEMFIKAASGTGIISSVMFLSDDLDEIDWEFMGGNSSVVETNYFGKGRQDFNNAIYYPVDGGVQADFHNYTTVWTNTSLDYYIDGTKVRTLLPKDANSTKNYPQTPMRISLGIWAGGDPTLPVGTREWAGGDTNYTQGPFNMYVRSARVTDYSSGAEYSYGDHTGSWESIKITAGNSTAVDTINAKPAESLADKWNNLSPVAHTAIYASAAGAGAILAALGLYYCIKQRRRGAEENRLYEARLAQERLELEQYKKAGVDPDSLAVENSEYNAREMSKDGTTFGNSYNIPHSPDSLANEKVWDTAAVGGAAAAGAAAGSGMRSPMPLLRNGAQSPAADRAFSPQSPRNDNSAMYSGNLNPQNRTQSPAPLISPMRSPSPGMPPSYSSSANPASRSFSAPNAQMRASPGPDMGGGSGIARSQSPGYMAPNAAPQRSYSSNTWRNPNSSAAPSYNGYGNSRDAPPYGGQGSYGENFDNNYWR